MPYQQSHHQSPPEMSSEESNYFYQPPPLEMQSEVSNFSSFTSTSEEQLPSPQVADLLHSLSLFFSLLMAFLCLTGVISNSLSLIIFFGRASSRRRSINVLLCGLSLSDLFLCMLALPVFSLAQLQQLVPGLTTARLLVLCYPICLMAQTMSVWMLVSITVDRWLAVCHPFSMRIHCTVKRARLTVLSIFLFSLGYNLVRFWEYRIDPAGQVVGLLRDDYLFMLLYQNLATTLSQFLLPLCVLCPLNLQITRAILAARERRKTLWAELSATEASREQGTAVMMLVVVLVFVLCYSLSLCLNVLEMFVPGLFRSPAGFLLNDVNNVLIVFNSASSSLFYARFSSRYRAQLFSLFRGCRRLCQPTKPHNTSMESPSRALSVRVLLNRPKLSTTILSVGASDFRRGSSIRSGRTLRAHSACPCPCPV